MKGAVRFGGGYVDGMYSRGTEGEVEQRTAHTRVNSTAHKAQHLANGSLPCNNDKGSTTSGYRLGG